MNHRKTFSARCLSSSRRPPARHTAMSSSNRSTSRASSPRSIAANNSSAKSTTISAAGMAYLLFVLVAGVRGRQPAADQRAQCRLHAVVAPVEFAGSDGGTQLSFIDAPNAGKCAREGADPFSTVGGKLAFAHAQRFGVDPVREIALARRLLPHVGR